MSKNNLFKLLFVTLFAFAATAFTGCSDDNDELTTAPVLVATPTSLSFSSEGGTRTIQIEANCAWTVNASTLEGWAEVTPLSGEGSGTLTVTAYESEAIHQGVITFSLIHEYYGKWGKAETTIAVKQSAGSEGPSPIGDALYEENCGSTTFKKADYNSNWPLTSAYDKWQRGGTLDQSGVVYGGSNSSVRCSGADYDDNTVSGQPFINVKTLEVSKVNIADKTNFTFQFVAQNTASTASESPYTPTFGDITPSSFKFEVGVNGTWYEKAFTATSLSGAAKWYLCSAEFQLPADVQTGELAFRWSGFSGGTTLRVDDLKLYEGGNGAQLGEGGGENPGGTYTFTKVSTVTSGKQYLFVADGKKAKFISTNYGYLQVDAVSDIDGKITLTSLEDAFTLTAADGGYTIAQSDNRYLIQTGTFNSFNVDAAPSEGQIFSIEPQSDGTFKILNTNVNKYMQYDTQYGSFGSYAEDKGTMPFLYELGEGGGENPGPGPGPAGKGATFDFAANGYANQEELPATLTENGFTLTFDKGGNSNGPKWYDSGSAVRFYANNTITVSGSGLKTIELVFAEKEYDFNKITTDVPTYTEPKWEGDATSVTFTIDGVRGEQSSDAGKQGGNRRIVKVIINGGEGGDEPVKPNPGPSGDSATIDFSAQGYADQQEAATISQNGYIVSFDKGSNSNGHKWFTNGASLRLYANNTMTVAGSSLKKIELVFAETDKANGNDNEITTDVPSYTEPVWTGDATSVTFTIAGTKSDGSTGGHRRLVKVLINGGSEGGDEPVNPDPTPGDFTSIADVLKLGEIPAGTKIEGIVISNADLNNLTSQKGMYVQDATSGLQLRCSANHTFKFGDKVQIDLSGLKVGAYNGAVQIEVALDKITKVSSGNTVEPKTVSIDDFLANKYEGQYVAIADVQVSDLDIDKTWVVDGKHTSIQMESKSGRNFYVFSSKYATYGTEAVAQGSGTIKGISAINNGVMQIIFAQASDYASLTGARFGAGEEPVEPKVTTAAYQNLTAESVTLGGSFEGFTTAPAEVGVEYILFSTGTVNDLNWAEATTAKAASVASPFTVNVSGLTAETQYAYRAYAGDVYGEPMTFVTDAATVTPDPVGTTYTKISSLDALTDGKYLIVYEDTANATAYVFNGEDAVSGYTAAAITNNTVSGDFEEIEIAAISGGYSLKATKGYMSGTAGKNTLVFNETASVNTIEFDGEYAKIASNSTTIRFNSAKDQLRFRYYKSGQQAVSLYKKN